MPCPLCDDTGWKPVEADGVRRVERCDCWRDGLTARLLEQARVPPRYRKCDLDTFVTYPNEKLVGAVKQARRFADEFPVSPRGLVPHRAAGHWQDSPGRRGAAPRDPQQGRARPVLRHARSAPRDPQHLQPAGPHRRDGHPPSGDGGGSARPRRHRLGEDLRMGGRDDEPDRQHPLQRAAADHLHLELRRHPRRQRSGVSEGAHRVPDSLAPARDV